MKIIAWTFSVLFHPLLYASLGTLLILFFLPYYNSYNSSYIFHYVRFVFILTYVLPLIAVPLYYLVIKYSKSQVSEKHQRIFLLISTSIMYVFAYKTMQTVSAFNYITYYLLICSILMVLSLIVTFFWKISLHMVGIGGFLGLLLVLILFKIPFLYSIIPYVILIAGFVASSRLYLKAHTPAQVYVGFFTGLILSVFFLYVFIIY